MLVTNLKQLRRLAACGLLACALAAPAASAKPADDSGNYGGAPTSSFAGTVGGPRQDLRSPDTRDAATKYAAVAVSEEPIGTPDVATSGGLDWSTAGVTAAVLVGLLVPSFGMAVAVRQRRRHLRGA